MQSLRICLVGPCDQLASRPFNKAHPLEGERVNVYLCMLRSWRPDLSAQLVTLESPCQASLVLRYNGHASSRLLQREREKGEGERVGGKEPLTEARNGLGED
ncbi:hypothetical protein ElyMa_000631600 [Elysia marginata]|uniref:Uncharacterized protein n=1 Tax=Elysia marginata TaxID=1093978 RepID=A0AAV4GBP9_9GAST|nr:hypothetical protein ElyMa_000631600 [Elysia marginata]